MLIVYGKNDKEILFNSGKSYVEPRGMSDTNGKLAVIEQIGGDFDDYGTYRLHDIEDKEKVNEIMQYQNYVKLVFDEDVAVDYEVDFEKYEVDMELQKERELLDNLIPGEEKIRKAETELIVIEVLTDGGLI